MWDLLLAPLSVPLDPSKRLFWGCLLSSLVVASVAVTIHAGRFDLRAQLRALFDRHYWLNRSTLQDVGLLFLNNAIRLLVLVPIVGSHLALTLATGRFLQANLGDAPSLELPWFAIATIYGLTFFVAEDASRFFLHLAMHRCPLLWRFHRVHHSARTLTPLTLFRQHPVEQALYFARGTVVFGVVSGFFIWLFGRHLTTFDILGVDLLGFLFNMAAANLRHSHVWLSFGPLERWFVSPAQHQLHHSRDHGNVNLGSYLAIWDRILGTAHRAGAKRELTFGLPESSARGVGPFQSLRRGAAPTRAMPPSTATTSPVT
ncbi:MAG: sterol desaturase family protein [Gammaproteobacteria bacterium]|nr:sterol desaturase family protein [Gammaproteobacteria bacterium]